jgi:hypothetical protein
MMVLLSVWSEPMGLQWEHAVDLLSEAFGRSEDHSGYLLWWVRDRSRRGTPCAIIAFKDKLGVHAYAGAEPSGFDTSALDDEVELLDVIQRARRLAEPR